MGDRLPQTTPRKMLKALYKLGFQLDKIVGSHHFVSNGNRRTGVPMHNRDLRRSTMNKILKQAGLTIDEIRPYL